VRQTGNKRGQGDYEVQEGTTLHSEGEHAMDLITTHSSDLT
jgi:hypothetical protein